MALTPEEARRLDCEVAEKVMGHQVSRDPAWQQVYETPDDLVETTSDRVQRRTLPQYSTSIADAWQVVEKLKLFEFNDATESALYLTHYKKWQIFDLFRDKHTFIASAETAPHAICLAALKALEDVKA